MPQARSFSTEGLVLKRRNAGEADRVMTILTRDQGKLVCMARGVRTIKSSKRAYLEPGTYIKCQLISTKSMPLLAQAILIHDTSSIHRSLPKIRQLMQLLEIADRLFVEESDQTELFEQVISIRNKIVCEEPTSGVAVQELQRLIENLGYQPFKETQYRTISEYVAAIADKPLKSWEYLKVGE